jgi:asparagine synthase (glutamine-hydrolysing)
MTVKRGEKAVQTRWWDIRDCSVEVPKTFEEQAEKFYEIFRDACRLRLISDVPVGTALSGGLDSTAVYSTVYDIMQHESLGRVNKDAQRAFTATFKGLPHDEREYAALAAAYTGGNITYLESDAYQLAEKVEHDTALCDFLNVAPITSISSVYAGMRKNGIIVSMDGHGVDEMLYGYRDMVYSLYNDALWNGSLEAVSSYESVLKELYHPSQRDDLKARFEKHLGEKKWRESSLKFKFKRAIKRSEDSGEYLPVNLPALSNKPYDFSSKSLGERMVYNEFFQHTLPALLRNFDRAGMINSVEIRMPFMDWRLVAYTFALPISSKIGGGFTKRIVRQAMKGKMEESLRTRTYKVGIGSPVEHWFNNGLKDWFMDVLDDSMLRQKAEKAILNGNIDSKLCRDIWQSINLKLIN